ncbi:hypothetical protein ACLKA6_001582 [Drosophila palustris]
MEASKQQNKSRIELFDNEERVKLIKDVQQRPILWDLTDKKQKNKARYKRRRRMNVCECGTEHVELNMPPANAGPA